MRAGRAPAKDERPPTRDRTRPKPRIRPIFGSIAIAAAAFAVGVAFAYPLWSRGGKASTPAAGDRSSGMTSERGSAEAEMEWLAPEAPGTSSGAVSAMDAPPLPRPSTEARMLVLRAQTAEPTPPVAGNEAMPHSARDAEASPQDESAGGTEDAPGPPADPITLDAFSHGKTVEARCGRVIVCHLASPPGGTWKLAGIEGDSLESLGTIQSPGSGDAEADGEFLAVFRAVRAGRSTVKYRYIVSGKRATVFEFTADVQGP
jgi:hypothetical protein